MQIKENILAVNEKERQFFYIHSKSIITDVTEQVRYIQTNKIFTFNQASEDCIANAVLKHSDKPSCPTETLPPKAVIFEEISQNKILFIIKAENKAYVVCNQTRKLIEKPMGIVNLLPNCNLESSTETWSTPKEKKLNHNEKPIYEIPLEDLNFKLTHQEPISFPTMKESTNSPIETVSTVKSFIDIEKENANRHIFIHYTALATIILGLIAFRLRHKILKYIKQKQSHDIPARSVASLNQEDLNLNEPHWLNIEQA